VLRRATHGSGSAGNLPRLPSLVCPDPIVTDQHASSTVVYKSVTELSEIYELVGTRLILAERSALWLSLNWDTITHNDKPRAVDAS
jgi:hypothetical protein